MVLVNNGEVEMKGIELVVTMEVGLALQKLIEDIGWTEEQFKRFCRITYQMAKMSDEEVDEAFEKFMAEDPEGMRISNEILAGEYGGAFREFADFVKEEPDDIRS